MFTKVKLTNFRKHTDRTFDFIEGLNVIRGPNESAKSTVLEAITYALFGANSLRESLEKTVTWSCKPSTLKVELEFTINSQGYRITRSSSGAELFVGNVLTVTGQREVTKYCEALLGTSADAAGKLMMANQASLRGALQDGPAAAVTLIENLANFDLIDSIVSLVQEKLPSGNTVALQSQIDTLTDQLEEPLVDETLEAKTALEGCVLDVSAAESCLSILSNKLETLRPEYDAAQAVHWKFLAAQGVASTAQKDKDDADKAVGLEPAPVDLSSVPALEKAIGEAAQRSVMQALFNQLSALKDGDEWEGSAQSLADEVARVSQLKEEAVAAADSFKALLNEWRLKLNTAKGKLITATHCAFCDKDLEDVPEVTTFNATWTPEILRAEEGVLSSTENVKAVDCEIAVFTRETKTLTVIQNAAAARASVYQKASSYITLDEGFVPARWSWTGPDLSLPVDKEATQKLKTLQTSATAYQRELGRYQAALHRAALAQAALNQALGALAPCEEAAQGCEGVFSKFNAASGLVMQAEGAVAQAKSRLKEAAQTAEYADKVHSLKLSARTKLQEQKAVAERTLKSTTFNNALLKKLRTAKPQVANKLWGVVLSTVSQTFSAIRGQPSVVSRGVEGFTVDGRSVGGLSGSTLDALGLAIRIALTKTFLPNTRFMVLDEASSACDLDRESSMVGAVVSADFDQVIWVTHSDAVESFAARAIQI